MTGIVANRDRTGIVANGQVAGAVCKRRKGAATVRRRGRLHMRVEGHLFEGEPSLAELLADPIIQAVILRDGSTSDEVAALIDRMRRRLADRRARSFQAGSQSQDLATGQLASAASDNAEYR
jgi:hypothetical protein